VAESCYISCSILEWTRLEAEPPQHPKALHCVYRLPILETGRDGVSGDVRLRLALASRGAAPFRSSLRAGEASLL
jgi:hypothetical protein